MPTRFVWRFGGRQVNHLYVCSLPRLSAGCWAALLLPQLLLTAALLLMAACSAVCAALDGILSTEQQLHLMWKHSHHLQHRNYAAAAAVHCLR